MIVRDALLAFVHFALILTLAGLLFSEVAIYGARMARPALRRLQRIDTSYGIVAGLIVLSGLSRMFFGIKGPAFYVHNPVFWMKMGLFVIVALLSIPPTMHYLSIAKQPGDVITVPQAAFSRMRSLLVAECVVLLLIPLFAALMARGL
jgi:putative membrane protein